LYNSTSGSAGGGGGTGGRIGGGGGWRLALLFVVGLVVDVEVTLGFTGADMPVFPGNG